jgi:uridine phosphorylase
MRMPSRLQPTASLATDAILVGDPGRALLLAQELLEQPKMSNHARGLWGYSGQTPAGKGLTIQSTGMGGPSAALVLGDLAKLGVRRAVRVGTCVSLETGPGLGELLIVGAAIAEGGSAGALGVATGARVLPDAGLTDRFENELTAAGPATTIASYDVHPNEQSRPDGVVAADMQTAPLLARARSLAIAAGTLLIVAETAGGTRLAKEALEEVEKQAGRVASAVLSG